MLVYLVQRESAAKQKQATSASEWYISWALDWWKQHSFNTRLHNEAFCLNVSREIVGKISADWILEGGKIVASLPSYSTLTFPLASAFIQ